MIKIIDTVDALESLKPTSQWILRGDDLEWLDDTKTQPTKVEITAEVSRLQAEYDSKQYSRDRAEAYAKLNQYEMMFDDQRDSTTTWVDAINVIKAQFPKPS
tara:strand:- start:150 stop:455 length:306 start_codon:yes stop_codon:yes gene_type:complete